MKGNSMETNERAKGAFVDALISSTNIPTSLRNEIIAWIRFNGGEFTTNLTLNCTHLVCGSPDGAKFEYAKNYGIQVVGVEWINQCVEENTLLDESNDVIPSKSDVLGKSLVQASENHQLASVDSKVIYEGECFVEYADVLIANSNMLFKGVSFAISRNFKVNIRETLERILTSKGATVLRIEDENIPKIDYFITNWKTGKYKKVLEAKKKIASTFWMFNCLLYGVVLPLDKAIYRVLKKDCFETEECLTPYKTISISGLEIGMEREDLKHMVRATGASYSPNLSGTTDLLICDVRESEKYKAALKWKTKIRSTKWLDEVLDRGVFIDESPEMLKSVNNTPPRPLAEEDDARSGKKMPKASLQERPSSDQDQSPPSAKNKRKAEDDVEDADVVTKSPRKEEADPIQANGDSDRPKCFLMTLIEEEEIIALKEQIEKLGGKVSKKFNSDTTHVISSKRMTRNLSGTMILGIASDVFIVKPDFIYKSTEAGRFISESEHEWEDRWMAAPRGANGTRVRAPALQGMKILIRGNAINFGLQLLLKFLQYGGAKATVIDDDSSDNIDVKDYDFMVVGREIQESDEWVKLCRKESIDAVNDNYLLDYVRRIEKPDIHDSKYKINE